MDTQTDTSRAQPMIRVLFRWATRAAMAAGVAMVAACAADQQFLVATHKAEAVPPLGTPVQLTAANFGSVPRVYVLTTQDRAVSYALQKTMLANAGGAAQVVEIHSSHVPMLSQPRALADAIADAAR
jgi:pimeloyl-ACP methyl ester carboxylesterase